MNSGLSTFSPTNHQSALRPITGEVDLFPAPLLLSPGGRCALYCGEMDMLQRVFSGKKGRNSGDKLDKRFVSRSALRVTMAI